MPETWQIADEAGNGMCDPQSPVEPPAEIVQVALDHLAALLVLGLRTDPSLETPRHQ